MMTTTFHEIQIGDVNCTVIPDGMATFGMEQLKQRFPDVPEADLLGGLERVKIAPDSIPSCFNTLLIRTGDEVLLVDAGNGAGREGLGLVLENLKAAGTQPEDITTVLISHLHGDHIAGLFDENMAFVFPNARYFVAQQEWSYWADKELLQSMGDYGKQLFEKMKKLEPEVKKITPGTQISPGVRTVYAPGHTAGHTGVMVESQGERLLHAVDILHSEIQFWQPDWSISFDRDKNVAQETRMKLLERAAKEDLLLLLYHLPFPGLGRVEMIHEGEEGDHFAWHPLDK